MAVERHHDHGNSYKKKILIGATVQRFSPLSSWRDMQADMVLEKELRVLHLGLQATGSGLRHWAIT